MNSLLWPLVLYFFIVLILLGAMILISSYLGETHKERTTGDPYESGMKLTGSAEVRVDVAFYLIAVFFVIFDLEALFVFAWAVVVRETGWLGYVEMIIFIGILLAALAYLWRIGALDVLRLRTGNKKESNRKENLVEKGLT